jgi:hypothetical protein
MRLTTAATLAMLSIASIPTTTSMALLDSLQHEPSEHQVRRDSSSETNWIPGFGEYQGPKLGQHIYELSGLSVSLYVIKNGTDCRTTAHYNPNVLIYAQTIVASEDILNYIVEYELSRDLKKDEYLQFFTYANGDPCGQYVFSASAKSRGSGKGNACYAISEGPNCVRLWHA